MKRIALAVCLAAVSAFGESYWGSYTNGVVARAPSSINGVVNPTGAMYLEAGYRRIIDTPPAYSNGYTAVRTAWTNEGVVVTAVYEYVQNPPAVHTYRKSFLAQWLYAQGKWETFNSALATVPDAAFLWSVCTEFDSDHAQWPQFLGFVVQALSLTDAEQDAMLQYGEVGHD